MKFSRQLCSLILSIFGITAHAQQVLPHLCIETGFHGASVWRIATDAKGAYVATGSEDKTVRIWNGKSGELIKTIRPYHDKGNQGKVFAVDISADAKLIVAAGKMSADGDATEWIYLFDRQSGEVIRKITNVPARVFHIRFSPDGKMILAALERGKGIVLYETATGRELGRDTKYENDIYGADFDKSGANLATVSLDGNLRIYSTRSIANGPNVKELIGDEPYSVAFSPSGNKLAVGCLSKPRVMLYPFLNGKIGTALSLDMKRIGTVAGNHLGMVCFTKDGQYVFAAGNARSRDDMQTIRSWKSQTGVFAADMLLKTSTTVLQITPTIENKLLFATAAPNWGILKTTGEIAFQTPANVNNYSGQAKTIGISVNGEKVKLRLKNTSFEESIFSLTDFSIVKPTAKDADFTTPNQPKAMVDQWNNTSAPTISGKPVKLDANEIAYSASLTPNNTSVILGSDRSLRSYGLNGQQKWQIPTPEATWAVNVSGDNRTVIAAFADGTIRWFRLADGAELLSVFIHPDGKRWIAWTPAGFYACAVGAEDLIGWHVNKSREQAADFFPVSRFRKDYYRPDIIRNALTATSTPPKTADELATKLPPVVTIISPGEAATIPSNKVTISYKIRSDEPVTNTKILVNGRPVDAQRGPRLENNAPTMDVPIPAGDVTVSVIAENRFGASVEATVKIKGAGNQAPAASGVLNILAVGVSDYNQPELKLNYAAKDAIDFQALAIKQKRSLYTNVSSKLLRNKEATKSNILEGLKWLAANTKSQDVAVFFLAGHGFNDEKEQFYFMPVEAENGKLAQTALYFEDIRQHLAAIPGKVIFFIDACNSANVMAKGQREADLIQVANISGSAENGIVFYTAAKRTQAAREKDDLENGVFTKAVLEGITGSAARPETGNVHVVDLYSWISRRVETITNGMQEPMFFKPANMPNFPFVPSDKK